MQVTASLEPLIAPARPSAALRTRAVDAGERALLLAALAVSLGANIASHRLLNLASLANDFVVVVLVLIRRPAALVSRRPLDWVLAFGASLGVLLMRPGGTPLVGVAPALALALPGWIVALGAKFSLNRAFGLVAANRGVKARGAYAVVRHPMYLGYLLSHIAYLLLNPTPANLAVWIGVCSCQWARIEGEERLLRRDPAYLAYCAKVRRRILPGLV